MSILKRKHGNGLRMMNYDFTPRGPVDTAPFSGCTPLLSALLRLRGITAEEEAARFLSPSLKDLHDPFLLPGMREAVELLERAIEAKDPILVWGDYDADGVCAAAILTETLLEAGARADYRLPSRHTEGYGLNEAGIREAAESFRVLVTVDCGISAREETALARSLGMTVIITDHHALPPELPEADALISPLLGGYPCPHLCGAGVALKICQAMRGMEAVEKRLDLAAIATVADVVPLLGENRAIVREGLLRIAETRRPGLKALLASAGLQAPLCADDLAFRIGPRLNAAGRLEDASVAAELLRTEDPARGAELASHLESLNSRRQSLEREITAQAIRQAEARPDFGVSRALVVAGDWNPGLVGLTAGRLCERYNLPAVAFSVSGDTATGSCRSIPGVNIFEMLQRCAGLTERCGGHAQAAGVTVRTDRIDDFRAKLDEVIRASCPETAFRRQLTYDLEVPFRAWTEESLRSLSLLEPTGCGNPPPVFLLSGTSVQSMRRVGRDMSHLQLTVLDSNNTLVKGIAFSQGSAADRPWTDADLLYKPILNDFRGKRTVEAQIFAITDCKNS